MARVVVFVLACLMTSVSAASSPWCEPLAKQAAAPWGERQLKSADIVFLGLVQSVKFVPSEDESESSPREAKSMRELLKMIERNQDPEIYDHEITFRLEAVWKGSSPKDRFVTVRARLRDPPHNPFRLAERYVVAATRLENDELYILSRCSDAIRQDKSDMLIKTLDEIAAAP